MTQEAIEVAKSAVKAMTKVIEDPKQAKGTEAQEKAWNPEQVDPH